MKKLITLLFMLVIILTGNLFSQTYFTEDFESAWTGSPAAPPSWTQTRVVYIGDGVPEGISTNGEKDWEQNTWTGATWSKTPSSPGTVPTGAQSGTGVCWMNDYFFGTTSSAYGSRRIESPTINLSSSTTPYVRFYYQFLTSSANLPVRVMASSDGGTTWNTIMCITGNNLTGLAGWESINVLIPAAYRVASAKIGFEFTNMWGTQNLWIDNLRVEEFTPTTITSLATGNWNTTTTWVGGVIPTADNHVVIAAGHTVTIQTSNIARCQDMTVNGTIARASSSTYHLHIFGNLLVNSGGTYNSIYSTTSGRRTVLGGNLTVNAGGTLNIGYASYSSSPTGTTTSTLWWVGGGTQTYTNSGTLTNSRISNLVHAGSSLVTYNSAVAIPGLYGLYDGTDNPNGNLTLGQSTSTTINYIDRGKGSFTSAPIFGTGITSGRYLYYSGGSYNFFNFPQQTITPANEVESIAGVRTVTGTLTMNTHGNVQLAFPLTIGSATTGSWTLSRGILITDATNLLTTTSIVSTNPTGIDPSTTTPPTTHGSYVVGYVRRTFAAIGTVARNFPLGIGTSYNGSTPSSNVRKLVIINPGTAASQSPTVSIEGAPSGTMNAPLTANFGVRTFRVNLNGAPDFPGTATIQLYGKNYTYGNSDNMIGDQSELRIGQSTATSGPWTERSATLGAGSFVNNVDYTRTTSTAAPGPIAPIATYGEYFTLASTAAVMSYTSSTTTQTVTSSVGKGSTNSQIIGIQVVMTGAVSPITLTDFNLTTNGSTSPLSDITNAKVWYTGTSGTFATTTQFGSTYSGPNGAFTVSGSQALTSGTNYFWVTYDIPCGATSGNTVDAECLSIVGSGAMGSQIPTITDPGTGRIIVLQNTVGTGTVSTPVPFYTYWMNERTDMLYTAAEINAAGCTPGCSQITALGFNIIAFEAYMMNGFNIKMQNTSATSLSGFTTSGWTTVYTGTFTPTGNGWNTITLTTPFNWDGTSNVLIEICFDNIAYGSALNTCYGTTTGSTTCWGLYVDDPGDGCTLTGGALQTRPNCQMTFGAGVNMAYSSSTATQTVTTPVVTNTTNNQVIGIEVNTTGICTPMTLTQFDLSTNGSSNPPVDITNAKIWYTGTSSTFAATSQFGSTYSGPNGAFSITGSQTLTGGTNYFWLSYDIPSGATNLNVVDGECSNVVINSSNYAPGTIAPFGNRSIRAPLIGTYNVQSFGGDYASLTNTGGIFEEINNLGMKGNVIILINSDLTAETGTVGLGQWTEQDGSGYTITIKPGSASVKTISGAVVGGLIKLNGCDRVTIDGNAGLADASGSKYLLFRNTERGGGTTFHFLNDARNNTIKDCTIEGCDTTSGGSVPIYVGNILFGTTTGSNGNDSNTINECDIRDRSDISGYTPNYGIVSVGTTTSSTHYNSHNFITNNNIYNFYHNGGIASGIFLTSGTGENWTITGNSLYQADERITTSNWYYTSWNVIFFGTTSITGVNVSNNYFGGSGPTCSGEPWRTTNSVAPLSGAPTFIYVLRGSVGTTPASTFQNNTVQNFRMNVDMTVLASGSTIFAGILLTNGTGYTDVGTTTGNKVGNNTDTGNVEINFTGTTAYVPSIQGIDVRGYGDVNNNIVGSFNVTGVTTLSAGYTFTGISRSGTPTSATSLSNNTVGSTSIANSILIDQYGATTNCISSSVGTIAYTVNNNTVANVTNNSTRTTAYLRGLLHSGSAVLNASGNIIRDLNYAGTNTGTSVTLVGLIGMYTSSISDLQSVSQNTIYNLNATNTGANNVGVMGFATGSSSADLGSVSRNKIYGLTNQATGTAPFIIGLNASWGNWTVDNNQVTITNGEATDHWMFNKDLSDISNINNSRDNSLTSVKVVKDAVNNSRTNYDIKQLNIPTPVNNKFVISGITDNNKPVITSTGTISDVMIPDGETHRPEDIGVSNSDYTGGMIIDGIKHESTHASGINYYYNSVYVGGSNTTDANNSYGFRKTATGPVVLKNNLFVNSRTSSGAGTGVHYSVGTTTATGWSSTSSNYNVFIATDTSAMGTWVGTNRNITEWRTSSSGDKQSWSTTSATISATNLFSSIASGNLNINSGNVESWIVSGKGIGVTGQSTDYEGTSRVTTVTGGCTDIGADEFGTPGVNPPYATEIGSPSAGTTSYYRLWGRTLCQIEWGPNGTFPSSMNYRYYSGINNPNVVSGGYQNGYSQISIGGGSLSSDAKYNIVFYPGDNETYTIGTPTTNTVLAKYESWGAWEVYQNYVSGWTNWKTQRTWNTGTNTYSIRVDSLQSFSDFALTDIGSALPVSLSEFNATVNRRDVNLRWVTTQEINNKGFQIQRRIKTDDARSDKSVWIDVKYINGHGTTNEQQVYTYKDAKLNSGKYEYRLKQEDYNGHSEYFNLNDPDIVEVGTPTVFDMTQNYPNPSNPKSKIDFAVPINGKVTMKIYDILGREVAVLIDNQLEAGYYTTEFDGTNLASGVYFYRIIADGNGQKFTKTLKMILVK